MIKRKSFYEFIDKKAREGRRQLHIIRDVLGTNGMKVSDFSEANEGDDPYIFVHNTERDSSFHGVRIYQIGNGIAFRIQREERTQPYGTAYALKISDMFADLVENMKEEEAGKKVMEYMCKELQKFFILSNRAENELPSSGLGIIGDPLDQMVISTGGINIARQVGNSI